MLSHFLYAMHNFEQDISHFTPENDGEQPEVNAENNDQLPAAQINNVRDMIASSVEEKDKEKFEMREKLVSLFTKFRDVVQDQKNTAVKVISLYFRAFNITGAVQKLDRMLDIRSKMPDDTGCYYSSLKKEYESLSKQLENGDSAKDEDFDRLSQLDKQNSLFELLDSGLKKRIETLRKPVNDEYLQECFRAIVLLERFPEFDEFPEFKKGPLSRFFHDNRDDIDAVFDCFEKSHHTEPRSREV